MFKLLEASMPRSSTMLERSGFELASTLSLYRFQPRSDGKNPFAALDQAEAGADVRRSA
jgi:hypothetical protein